MRACARADSELECVHMHTPAHAHVCARARGCAIRAVELKDKGGIVATYDASMPKTLETAMHTYTHMSARLSAHMHTPTGTHLSIQLPGHASLPMSIHVSMGTLRA